MNFDTNQYKVWQLPSPLLLHWIINPVMMFNELLLGQRLPKVMLIDKMSDAPLMERTYIPCPHCNTLNDGRIWAKKNAFGNWFGYLCPNCYRVIPCLWNVSSLFVLAITSPCWYWFRPYLKKKWLKNKKAYLLQNADRRLPEAKTTPWLKVGIIFGLLMFCFMVVPLILLGNLTISEILVQAAISLGSGLAFGGFIKFFMGRSK